jgi:hypothetical protein
MTPSQKKIERSYQRAMNIRDSTPGNDHKAEERYTQAYIRCYRNGKVREFSKETRRYLKQLRAMAV